MYVLTLGLCNIVACVVIYIIVCVKCYCSDLVTLCFNGVVSSAQKQQYEIKTFHLQESCAEYG